MHPTMKPVRVIRAIRGCIICVILLGSALRAQSPAPFSDSIRAADLRADLFFLAGDGFKGRLVGTAENALDRKSVV